MFLIKKIVAFVCYALGVSNLYLWFINKKYKNNYVRVINYHNTENENIELFKKQIALYQKEFEIIDYEKFKQFLNKKLSFSNKPGLLITFDDGYICQYNCGAKVLDAYGIKGLFFVSPKKKNDNKLIYMNNSQFKELSDKGHSIGCHTSTHYRFNQNDDKEKLFYEIIESKQNIENAIEKAIDSFCYVGGELPVYTNESFELIKENYECSFTTLTQISTNKTNKLLIHRTNIESNWNMSLVKFQLSGLMDLFYKNKVKYIENKLL